jgi:AcrR family transcriptional regulator
MSVTQTRKDREKAARGELILDHAGRLLLRDGYQNLNLDELAEAIEYSKGTIYLHFKTKEDLVLAIATRIARQRADLFERGSTFVGKTRERMRAIGFACCEFAVKHRDYFNIEMMLKSLSFWEKASEEHRRLHGVQAGRLFHYVNAIAQEAVTRGDLPPGTRPQDVTLGLISITIGSHIAAMQPDIQMLCAIEDPICALRRNQDMLLDGWKWKPLLNDWDYAATDRRIKAEVFPEAAWYGTR